MDARRMSPLWLWLSLLSIAAAPKPSNVVTTDNFVVTAPTHDIALKVAQCAEKYRKDLAIEWLGHELPQWYRTCPIFVKVGDIGAGGATSFTFERGEVFGWDMRIQGSLDRILDSVLPHEVSHTIFACHFRRPLPRWADEGAATLVECESERRRQVLLMRQVLGTSRRIPLKSLLSMKEYPKAKDDVYTLYAEGYSLADLLVQKGGKARYLSFLNEAHQHGWERALQTQYDIKGVDLLEKNWLEWVMAGSPALDSSEGVLLAQSFPHLAPLRKTGTNPAATSLASTQGTTSRNAASATPSAASPTSQPPAKALASATAGGRAANPPPKSSPLQEIAAVLGVSKNSTAANASGTGKNTGSHVAATRGDAVIRAQNSDVDPFLKTDLRQLDAGRGATSQSTNPTSSSSPLTAPSPRRTSAPTDSRPSRADDRSPESATLVPREQSAVAETHLRDRNLLTHTPTRMNSGWETLPDQPVNSDPHPQPPQQTSPQANPRTAPSKIPPAATIAAVHDTPSSVHLPSASIPSAEPNSNSSVRPAVRSETDLSLSRLFGTKSAAKANTNVIPHDTVHVAATQQELRPARDSLLPPSASDKLQSISPPSGRPAVARSLPVASPTMSKGHSTLSSLDRTRPASPRRVTPWSEFPHDRYPAVDLEP